MLYHIYTCHRNSHARDQCYLLICCSIMNDDVEAFFDLAESFVTYVKHCYEEEMDQGIKDDVADAIEQVFQYGMLVIDDADERYVVIDMLQNLVLLMKSASRGCVHVSKHGRPKIDIGEEQLSNQCKLCWNGVL